MHLLTKSVSSIIRSKPEYSVFGRVNLTRLSFIGHIIIREAPPIQEMKILEPGSVDDLHGNLDPLRG